LGNGELASLAYGSFKELHKIESLLLEGASPPGGGLTEYLACMAHSMVGFRTHFGWIFKRRFCPCFDRHFHGSFFGW
jgi:hypothetical protein